MPNVIQNNYFIPVVLKEKVDNSVPVTEEVNSNYLLYKCIKKKQFYVFKLEGCSYKNIKQNIKEIVVFSANNYKIGDYFLISREILYEYMFPLKTSITDELKKYYGYNAISETDFII